MRYFSMFSGIGGFELGIQQAYENNRSRKQESIGERTVGNNIQRQGDQPSSDSDRQESEAEQGHRLRQWSCIGYSEIDKYAIQIYNKHFNHTNYGNATTIDPNTLPDFDLICGGFPCQAFSIAGKRGGFDDTRGTLFFDIARIAKCKEPMFLLLENVKGLVSHDNGKTLETILLALQELGYYVNIEIYNSKDFGVPQNRERIFFICTHLKGLLSIGQNQKITSSERIIEQWLFQLLLNDLDGVKKLQGLVSKDYILAWLISQEINRNQKLNGKNIWDGITIPMGGGIFQSKDEEAWQNIGTWLNKNWVGDLPDLNTSTTSIAIKKIIESKTYTYSQMFKAILLATILLRNSSKNLWNEILFNLTLIQDDTNYARIDHNIEEAIVTEDGNAHFAPNLQDFQRYFIIGHLRGTSRTQVFPFGGSNPEADGENKSNTIDANYWKGIDNHGARTGIIQLNEPSPSNNRIYSESGIAPAINTMQGGNRQPKVMRAPLKFLDRNQKNIEGDYAFTVDSMNTGGVSVDSKIRRLTPTECERLQGYPDGWTEGISDTQRYKTLGNSVTVNVIQAIAEKLVTAPLKG